MLFKSDQCLKPLSVINILVRRSLFLSVLLCTCESALFSRAGENRVAGSPNCLLARTPTIFAPGQESVGHSQPLADHSEDSNAGLSLRDGSPLQPGVPSQPSWPYPASDFTAQSLTSLSLSSTDLLCGLRPFLPSASPHFTFTGIYFSLQISCISSPEDPN